MNANELADELKEIALISDNHTKIVLGIAETMLRQQQAEIDNLAIVKYLNGVTISKLYAEIEALKKEAALQRLSDFTQEAECKHGVDDGACKECYIKEREK